jgi:hypothetical protein
MGFGIQIVSGKAEARAVVPGVPGRADNAARDDLGPKTAIMIRQTRPSTDMLEGNRRLARENAELRRPR